MQSPLTGKHFLSILLIVVAAVSILILSPFLTTIILGASFAVVLRPVHRWLTTHITRGISWIASLMTVLLFLILLCGPLFGAGVLVFNQSEGIYTTISTGGSTGPFLDTLGNSIEKFLPAGFEFDIHDKLAELVTLISSNIATIFSTTLTTIFSFLLMILTMFYFLKDGAQWTTSLIGLSPLPNSDDEKILKKLSRAINGVIKGYLLIALMQGVLTGIGMQIFGVPNAALFGVLAGIASLIPSIGTALVAVPAIIFLFATGHTANAVGFAIWATALVGMVDNFLNPYIVGTKLQVPPLLILFAVLGGISLMGPVGILIGPLTMSLLYVLTSLYRHGLAKE